MTQQHDTARSEAFGYICRACSRCCYHKVIQVNPYEIARLARHLGRSISEFRKHCTEDGAGAVLRRNSDDVCIFLGMSGCSVHADRPLVCRLYPLGRRVAPDGTETWLHTRPHPQSEGRYSRDGTIADYITAQGALPYIRAADEYAEWVRKAHALTQETRDAPDAAADLLDMDAAISAHCRETQENEPADIEARRRLHMKILYRELERFQGGKDGRDE